MPDDSTGLDRIEFRRSEAEYGHFCGEGSAPCVEIVINGVELTHLWNQEKADDGVLALEATDAGEDLSIWGPYHPSPGPIAEVPSGFVPVVTCGCGIFGCGGGYVRVTFLRELVQWHDFRSATGDRPIGIGSFTFDREQYESARLVAQNLDH
jgi:hypothetical protein